MSSNTKKVKDSKLSDKALLQPGTTESQETENDNSNQKESFPGIKVTAKFLLDELMKKIAESGEELSQLSLVDFMKLLSGLSKTFPEIQSFLHSSDLNSLIEKRNKEEKKLAEKIMNDDDCLKLATDLLTALNGKNGKK